jgi:hypothetical protein
MVVLSRKGKAEGLSTTEKSGFISLTFDGEKSRTTLKAASATCM